MIFGGIQTDGDCGVGSLITSAEVSRWHVRSAFPGRRLETLDTRRGQTARVKCVDNYAGPKSILGKLIQNLTGVRSRSHKFKDWNAASNQNQVLSTRDLFQAINHIIRSGDQRDAAIVTNHFIT